MASQHPRARKHHRKEGRRHDRVDRPIPCDPCQAAQHASDRSHRAGKKASVAINPSSGNYPRPYTCRAGQSATRPVNARESSHIRFPDRQTGALTSTTGAPTSSTGKSRSSSTPSTSSASSRSSRPTGYPKPLGHGNGFPVVSVVRYLRTQSSSFHIIPGPARRYRTYEIQDKYHEPCFRVVPTPLCLRETKTLYDLRRPSSTSTVGSLVLKSHQLVFSTRGRVFIHDLRGKSLMYLQKVNIVNFPKIIHGFVKSTAKCAHSDNKPQLIITEEKEDGRCYVIRDKRSNEVACIERYRLTPRNERKKKYAYKLYVSAGYDYSLFVMCSVLLLDMWNRWRMFDMIGIVGIHPPHLLTTRLGPCLNTCKKNSFQCQIIVLHVTFPEWTGPQRMSDWRILLLSSLQHF